MHIYVNSILLIYRDRTIINSYIPWHRGHIKYWKTMDEKARNLLDRNLHIRVTNQFEQQLTIFEQFEMINKARLSLSLRSPNDDASLEDKMNLYEEQKLKILNFIELLHDSLITEHGKVLLCLYQCE